MTQDPIERLLREHVELMAALAPFRRAVESLADGGPEALEQARPILRAGAGLLTTELIAHARREDDVFFPAVEAALGAGFGPTRVMRQEHVMIRDGAEAFHATLHELHEVEHPAIVEGGERLRDLVDGAGDAGAFHRIGTELLQRIDDHFAKEEQILFPMSRSVLDAEDLAAVARLMDALDAE